MHTQPPFTRPTIIAAVEFLGDVLTQAHFDQLIVRFGLENEIPSGTEKSVTAKSALLARSVMQRAAHVIDTVDGEMTLAEAIVRAAVAKTTDQNPKTRQTPFIRGLARDGYVVAWGEYGEPPLLRAALPEEINLPATDDEVHQLLKQFGFATSLGHLDQAIAAHTRGDWAAANGQMRTFIEGLFDDIARRIRPQEAAQRPSAENRRALLADVTFLSTARNEWTADGKNYINGLFKMLHTDGSHPGLSDEDHSTFRLHIVLVTARTFLRRLNSP